MTSTRARPARVWFNPAFEFDGDFTDRRKKKVRPSVDQVQAQRGTSYRRKFGAPLGPCPVAALCPDARLRRDEARLLGDERIGPDVLNGRR